MPAHAGVSRHTRALGARPGTVSRVPPAWTITAVLGLLYLIIAPRSADLAAATYRSDLFGRVGFTVWDNGWYAGHHLPAYSVLAPALGWLIGPPLLAVLSMTTAAALFAALIDGRFPARAQSHRGDLVRVRRGRRAARQAASRSTWGSRSASARCFLGQRDRRALALLLAVLCALASPVAGAFLALAALAWALAGQSPPGFSREGGARYLSPTPTGPRHERHLRGVVRARWFPALLTLAALAPIAVLELAFPEGGSQPFVPSAFYPGLVGLLAIALLIGAEQRALRIGTLLYAGAYVAAYVIPTAVGANVDRLGALVAGPVAACVLAGRSSAAAGAVAGARAIPSVLAGQRSDFGLRLDHLEPVRAGLLLRAPARGAARARRRLFRPPGTHRGGPHERPLGGARGLPRTLRSPVAGSASWTATATDSSTTNPPP